MAMGNAEQGGGSIRGHGTPLDCLEGPVFERSRLFPSVRESVRTF